MTSRSRNNHPAKLKAKVVVSVLREDATISELAVKYACMRLSFSAENMNSWPHSTFERQTPDEV